MDFQNRAGGKTGTGGVASASESNRDRRERLRQLALETIDINKVQLTPYTYISLCTRMLLDITPHQAIPLIQRARLPNYFLS